MGCTTRLRKGWLVQLRPHRQLWAQKRNHASSEWAVHSVGDVVPGGPINFSVREIDAPNDLVLELSSARRSPRLTFTMSYVLRPIGDSTRLISRVRSGLRAPFGTVLLRSTLGPGDGVMLRRQLLGIKERAEQHDR